jgi:hypothetical protein
VPTVKALAARIGSFWLPSQTVLFIGTSDASVARRVAADGKTELGDRRPAAGGHWLKTLRSLDGLKVWWAATAATEEYEDALLPRSRPASRRPTSPRLPDRTSCSRGRTCAPTGERKATG